MALGGSTNAWRRTTPLDARYATSGGALDGGLVPASTAELRVLVPTTFSAGCHRAGLALAQLARSCRLAVTVVHVTQSGRWNAAVSRALDGVFADLPGVPVHDRTLLFGDRPADLVSELCVDDAFDLVMAPASAERGLRGWVHRSFRARLLARCGVPLWTAGARLPAAAFGARLRSVACLIDLDDEPGPFLATVAAFARRLAASVHALALVPAVDDGTLATVLTSNAPLSTADAERRLGPEVRAHACQSLHVVDGGVEALPRLLARCGADVLVVGRRPATTALRGRVSRVFDALACPVVCIAPPRPPVPRAMSRASQPWTPGFAWADPAVERP